MGDEKLYNDVHNYTKFKLVEMLINRLNDGRTKVDDMNSIENLADDVLKTLANVFNTSSARFSIEFISSTLVLPSFNRLINISTNLNLV